MAWPCTTYTSQRYWPRLQIWISLTSKSKVLLFSFCRLACHFEELTLKFWKYSSMIRTLLFLSLVLQNSWGRGDSEHVQMNEHKSGPSGGKDGVSIDVEEKSSDFKFMAINREPACAVDLSVGMCWEKFETLICDLTFHLKVFTELWVCECEGSHALVVFEEPELWVVVRKGLMAHYTKKKSGKQFLYSRDIHKRTSFCLAGYSMATLWFKIYSYHEKNSCAFGNAGTKIPIMEYVSITW